MWVITGMLMGVVLFLAVPLLIGAGYTYPAADDFIIENGSLDLSKYVGPVKGPLYAALNYYKNWQGAYTANLLLFTIMPFTRSGLNGFRILMVLLSLSFLFSLYFLVDSVIVFSHMPEDRWGGRIWHSRQNKKLFLYAVLLFTVLGLPGTWIGKEIFYWYTAVIAYLVGIDCLFISIGFLLLANCWKRKKGYYLGSAFFAFLASGTSLQVTSFVCSWLLLVLLVLFMSVRPDMGDTGKRSLCIKDTIPFLSAFAGALINTFSPGNMLRSQATMGDIQYGVFDAVKDTAAIQIDELAGIFHDPFFLTIVFVMLFSCICFKIKAAQNIYSKTPLGVLLVTVGVLVSNFLCIFPVVLGYHGSGLSSQRTKYVAELEIRFSILFAVMYLSQYIQQLFAEKVKQKRAYCLAGIVGCSLVCIGAFLCLNDQPEELFSGYSFELIKEISDGRVKGIFSLRKEVLEEFEAAEDGTDIYVKMPPLPPSRATYSQGIAMDPNDIVNAAVADMFHLNSVAVEYGAK